MMNENIQSKGNTIKNTIRNIVLAVMLISLILMMSEPAAADDTGSMSITNMNKGTESVPVRVVKYTQNSTVTVNGMKYNGKIYKISPSSAGVLKLRFIAKTVNHSDVQVGLFKDAGCTSQAADTKILTKKVASTIQEVQTTKQTRYIAVYSEANSDPYTNVVTVQPYMYNCTGRTLSNNTWCGFASMKAKGRLYFKFKAKYTGYMRVYGHDLTPDTVQLLKSNKKAASVTTTQGKAYYGVMAGKTYYVRIAPKAAATCTRIKVSNKSWREFSGRNRTAAVLKIRNRSWKGTIAAGSTKADWYRVKIGSKRSFRVYAQGRTCGKINIKLYTKKGRT